MGTNDIFDYIVRVRQCTTTISSRGNIFSPSPHVTRTKSLYKYSDILFKYLNHLPR